MKKRNKVVVDTGVLVSAFAFGGVPGEAVRKAAREALVCVSPRLLEEYRAVPLRLEKLNKINHEQLKSLISGISVFVSNSLVVHPRKALELCRDPKDNMLLECCLEAKADTLLTGDKDLLEIDELPFKLKILTPARYIRRTTGR